MWNTPDGERVLTQAEWDVFEAGLALLRDFIEDDIEIESDETDTGILVFDRLTAEQKLALLADVASALRDPSIPAPDHTASNEGAIAAVCSMVEAELEMELDGARMKDRTEKPTAIRNLLRADPANEELPPADSVLDVEAWRHVLEEFENRMLFDMDFMNGDAYLDLSPEAAAAKREMFGVEADYFLAVPDEPTPERLKAARRKLSRLVGDAAAPSE